MSQRLCLSFALLAYALAPAVQALVKRRVPRPMAVFVVELLFILALLAFNLGVVGAEAGVIALTLGALSRLRAHPRYRERALIPLSLAIAGMGAYWTVTRIVGR